jgi:Holliday junction resolvase RusA-like endonuclease
LKLFIPGKVPALKNSKQIVATGPRCRVCKRGKFPKLISSKRVKQWKTETKPYWEKNKKKFLWQADLSDKPLHVEFQFVRKSKHKFDYTNALDTVQDEMVAHGWLEDDNADEIIPVIVPFKYDKMNPGVYIRVLNDIA